MNRRAIRDIGGPVFGGPVFGGPVLGGPVFGAPSETAGTDVVRGSGIGRHREDVPTAFDAAAGSYDLLTGLNPGYHRDLRLSVRRIRLPRDGAGLRLLDIGCGTGASTAALLAVAPRAEILAVDAAAEMLTRARAKRWPSSVQFAHSSITELPNAEVHGPFDAILAAYLLRNLAEPVRALRVLRTLLKPGATLAVHEYSVRESLRARMVWNAVCLGVIIPSAKAFNGNTLLYRYLWHSVRGFVGITELRHCLYEAGYTAIHSETMPGWRHNVLHTVLASAPVATRGDAS